MPGSPTLPAQTTTMTVMTTWNTVPAAVDTASPVAATAAAVGWEGAFLVRGGYARPEDLPGFMVPRYNVPAGLSPDGLAARIAGWLGG